MPPVQKRVSSVSAYSWLLAVPVTLWFAPKLLRRIQWALRPNYGPVILEIPSRSRLHIRLRLKSSRTAAKWFGETPTVNLVGMEGLAWLDLYGARSAERNLLEALRLRNPGFAEIESELQHPADLQRQIMLALQAGLA